MKHREPPDRRLGIACTGGGWSLMARCAGVKRDGSRCTAIVKGSQTGLKTSFCYQHDPDRSEERKRNASRAAKTRPNTELRTMKGELRELIENVLSGSVGKGEAAVAIQGYNALGRVLELERKIREQDEILVRIEALEESTGGDHSVKTRTPGGLNGDRRAEAQEARRPPRLTRGGDDAPGKD